MRSPSAWSYVTFLCVSPLALGACPPGSPATTDTESNVTTDTGSETGTATDNCPIGAADCPCTDGGGCNPGLVCSAQQTCVDDTATTTVDPVTGSTSGTTTEEPETLSSDPATTEPGTECDPDLGALNPDCVDHPNGPYCSESGVCGGCTVLPAEAGCDSVAPGKPVCNGDDGQCVACTADDDSQCGGDTPACNPDLNECVGCFEHSHCPTTACNLALGECFDPNNVLYVQYSAAKENCVTQPMGGGTEDSPYCNANLAVNHAENSGVVGWTIKMLAVGEQQNFHGSILFSQQNQPVTYALVHELPANQEEATYEYYSRLSAPEPVITVGGDVTLYVHNFALTPSAPQNDGAMGLQCGPGAKVYLDDSVIRDARGPGIRANGCDVWLRRSMVYRGRTEGVHINDGELHMVNSFITANEWVQADGGGGIRAENVVLDIVSSTILENHNEHGVGGDSIECVGDTVTGTIRNSVIARTPTSDNLSINCAVENRDLVIVNSLIDSEAFKDNNQKGDGKMIALGFDDNTVSGAYRILDAAADGMHGVAIWHKGDPRYDFEGQARVAKEGAEDYPGADVWMK